MTRNPRFTKRLLTALAASVGLLALTETSQAQELYMTGPLAGAPAVRKLRLYRQARFEIAPAVTFTMLDEYQRSIILGGRLQYNFTDWLALGAWGGVGNLINLPTSLTDHIQDVNSSRRATYDGCNATPPTVTEGCSSAELDHRLTAVNLGPNLEDQLGVIDWIVAPQLTLTPFRGKLALFQSIYLDTDLYISAGAAFMGVTERKNCDVCVDNFERASRVAIAPTAAVGFSFYVNKWSAIGWETRVTPFKWNNSGFDTAGGGKDGDFPDNKITSDDRRMHLNLAMTLSYNILLPTALKVSE